MRRLLLLLAFFAFTLVAFWCVKCLNFFANSSTNFVARYSISAHPDPVVRMTFSPDGKLLVTRGRNNRTVKVWKVKDGRLAYSIAVTPAQPISFAFSPDAEFLAIAYADGSVRIFNPQSGQFLRAFQKDRQVAWQGQVLFSPDGKLLAQTRANVLSGESEILIWRISDSNLVRSIKFGRWMHGFAFSPDGKSLAVVGCIPPTHLKVTLWDTNKWSQRSLLFAVRKYPCIANLNEPVKFLPSRDKLVVTFSHAQTLFVLNIQRKGIERSFRVATLPYSIDPSAGVAWNPDFVCDIQGQLVAIVEIKGISVFLPHRLSEWLSHSRFLWAHDLSLKLERLTMKNLNKAVAMVNVYRLHDGHKVATLVGDGWISAVALSPDGRHLAMGHVSGKVMMWKRKD